MKDFAMVMTYNNICLGNVNRLLNYINHIVDEHVKSLVLNDSMKHEASMEIARNIVYHHMTQINREQFKEFLTGNTIIDQSLCEIFWLLEHIRTASESIYFIP
jgi:hypothetical protein